MDVDAAGLADLRFESDDPCRLMPCTVDISSGPQVAAAFESVAELGGYDVLVNAAGSGSR